MRVFSSLFLLLLSFSSMAEIIDDEIEIKGHLVELGMSPDGGGALHTFGLVATPTNLAGGDGLLQEGFGVGSFYVPNRRLNERMEALDSVPDRPVLQYTYDCDGPNIQGLLATRKMELIPDEASVRVTWTVKNNGKERQWVAPWVRNDVTPGGTVNEQDRFDVPTRAGIIQPTYNGYLPASRNWFAMTDPVEDETLYAVYNANHTHSFLVQPYVKDEDGEFPKFISVQTAFVPFLLGPGETWTTQYRLNMVRGLKHVDFATEEFAMQIDYVNGKLTFLVSAVKSMPGLQVDTRIKSASGEVWTLPRKQFDLAPSQLARCSYDWKAPANGAYEVMAQVSQNGKVLMLGQETASPHGGIDTRFNVGPASATPFRAWTDGPHALDQQARTMPRTLAVSGPVTIWAEPSLRKILPQDIAKSSGPVDPVVRVALAQGESESFQLAIRPKEKSDLNGVNVSAHDLVSEDGSKRIPASAIKVYTQQYQYIAVPSNFEGPTGYWPDALVPFKPFDARGGVTTPLWFTLHAATDTAAGKYSGLLELQGEGLPPVELFVEVEVFDFKLPSRPMLKTDFVFDSDQAFADFKHYGGKLSQTQLEERFFENAAEHRVTLRNAMPFPSEQPNFPAALAAYKARLAKADPAGVSTISIPQTLLNHTDQLALADAFVKENGLENRAFVHLANEPPRPAWPRIMQGIEAWKAAAPDIPVMITTYGLEPFLPDALERWAVHAPIFDSVNNSRVLERIGAGGEVWWYVDQTPPRPYGNFFIDFEGIEHRILFWQAWALGVRGMHYHGINDHRGGGDPWKDLCDVTPVNGDGFLVYTDATGPVNSLRWENIRDGIEDYDYLAIFNDRRRKLLATPGHEALLQRAAAVYNLKDVIPSLVDFTRDPAVMEARRRAIAAMIVEMNAALHP